MRHCPACRHTTYRDADSKLRCSVCCWHEGMGLVLPQTGKLSLVSPAGPLVVQPRTLRVDPRMIVTGKKPKE
jgi:ribosomal protein S27E